MKAVEPDSGMFLIVAPRPVMSPYGYYFFVVKEKLYRIKLSGERKKTVAFDDGKIESSEELITLKQKLTSAFMVYGDFIGVHAPLDVVFEGDK